MRFSPRDYAQAFRKTVLPAPAAERPYRTRRFLAAVRKHGGFSRIGEVVRMIEASAVAERGARWIELEFARPMDDKVISRFRALFSPRDRMNIRINPALVAGVRITMDGETEFDHTLKRKLDKLFPRTTATHEL